MMVALMITSLTSELAASSWYNPTTWSMPSRESLYNMMPSTPQWVNSLRSGWSNLSTAQQAALAGLLSAGVAGAGYYGWNQRQQRLEVAKIIAERKEAENREIERKKTESPKSKPLILELFNNMHNRPLLKL